MAAVSAIDEPNMMVVTPAQTARPVHMGQGSQVETSSAPVRSGLPQVRDCFQDGRMLGVQARIAPGDGGVVGRGPAPGRPSAARQP